MSALSDTIAIQNQAGIARLTCGWKKPHLPLESVRRYWRDVHSPAISRRAGLWEYRHSQFEDVTTTLFAPIDGIDFSCPADEQLMWLSDVRYRDQAALDRFSVSPDGEVKAHMLADIDLLVDKSTTYRAVGDCARTYSDITGSPTPAGPAAASTFGVFIRQRSDDAAFQNCLRNLCTRWAAAPGVLRVRLNLFEVPDMEAERKAGYPIKTHPLEMQHQAWIELVLKNDGIAKSLFTAADGVNYAAHIRGVHVYPLASLYTFVYAGKPTLIGLRGYAAFDAINFFNAHHQREPSLLAWMYGPVVEGERLEMAAE